MVDINDISQKYSKKLMRELGNEEAIEAVVNITQRQQPRLASREYEQFKDEIRPTQFTHYERACNLAEKIFKLTPSGKTATNLQEALDTCHLNVTPTGTMSLSILLPIVYMLFGMIVSFVVPTFFGGEPSMFFVIFFLFSGLIAIIPLQKIPFFMANNWRMEASNQMVLSIFYIVTYMRHTSNLELAIEFASHHLTGPLALDLKKVLWDIETQKYTSLKESLDLYLERWRKWNVEYIEAMHLIESSLFESHNERRLGLLDKSLDVILDETFEKMLHYAHNLKSPVTMLHMLGIVLPVLGLVILPLMVNFMEGVKWYYLSTLYNIVLPIGVYLLGKSILSQRPTGYGESDLSEKNPQFKKYRYVNVLGLHFSLESICWGIGIFCIVVGLLPLVLNFVGFPDVGFGGIDPVAPCGFKYCLLGYNDEGIGPFGIGSTILSLFFPIAGAFSFGLYWRLRTSRIMKIREETKKLEKEFASALFQLGNRLGDNNPAEIAFGKVASIMEGTTSAKFFQHVNINITKLGLSVQDAIFHPRVGALIYFPSNLIQSSMKVFIQAIRKGPKVAANSLVNIARYIKEMHKVDERLKDLLSDTISSMKSQISLLTPAIAGIVIGITSMITTILGKIGPQLAAAGNTGGADFSSTLPEIFSAGIPTYYFQFMVGVYVVQIVAILSLLVNGIENGSDKLNGHFLLGKNVINSTVVYVIIAAIVIIVFNVIAGSIIDTSDIVKNVG